MEFVSSGVDWVVSFIAPTILGIIVCFSNGDT